MRSATLTATLLVVLLAATALGQLPGPPAQAGQGARGVGQGLAPPPNGAQQGAQGQAGGRGGGRGAAAAGPALPTDRKSVV